MDTQTLEAQIVSKSPDMMGGTPVFAGTRVPIQTLLDYVEAGDSIDDFLDGFPTVRRDQVIGLLDATGLPVSPNFHRPGQTGPPGTAPAPPRPYAATSGC